MRPVIIVVARPRPGAASRRPSQEARRGRAAGFFTALRYIATDSVEENVARVAARAEAGGHAAPPAQIRAIHEASLNNLAEALDVFDRVRVYDNTALGVGPRLVLEARRGRVTRVVGSPPAWLRDALRGTAHERALPASPDPER